MNSIPHLRGEDDAFPQLQAALGNRFPQQVKLHLGCGEIRLDGYINIDFPPSQHTVQKTQAADVFADLTLLHFGAEKVDEVRLHHVFEHFDRPTALALLAAWHQWLTPHGRLVIETPDLNRSLDLLADKQYSLQEKQIVLRHLFGSHEASWAVHYDGWYEEKFRWILTTLGYHVHSVTHGEWKLTRNVTATAERGQKISNYEIGNRAKMLLKSFLVDDSGSEMSLWKIWCERFDQVFERCCAREKHPTVSIFVPVYNREQYLPQTLQSLLAQTYSDFEIIVADDGSTDRSREVAQIFAARDPRVKLVALEHQGEVATRNAAVACTDPQSKYLLNHDSDDISLPTKLERLVQFLDSNPGIAIAGCQAVYFDDAGNDLGQPAIETSPERIRATFGTSNSMINSAALMRREVMRSLQGYREEFRSVDDYDFFARALLANFQLANVPEILHLIRIHPQSVGSTRVELQASLAQKIRENYKAQQVSE